MSYIPIGTTPLSGNKILWKGPGDKARLVKLKVSEGWMEWKQRNDGKGTVTQDAKGEI